MGRIMFGQVLQIFRGAGKDKYTVETKPLVLCGECKWCDHSQTEDGFGWCMCPETALYNHGTRDDFYCANAERKEDKCLQLKTPIIKMEGI